MLLLDHHACKRMRVNGKKRSCPDTASTAPKSARTTASMDYKRTSHWDDFICSPRFSASRAVRPSIATHSAVQVFIKHLTGQSVGVNVHLDQDVQELANVFAQRKGILDTRLRFVYGGKQLEIGRPLQNYGILKGSNIHLTAVLKSECLQATAAQTPVADASGGLTAWNSARVADCLACCHLYPAIAQRLSPKKPSSRRPASGYHGAQSLKIVFHDLCPYTCSIQYDVKDFRTHGRLARKTLDTYKFWRLLDCGEQE